MRRTPFDPDTEYELIRSETPISDDGFKIGEPLGLVKCCECNAIAKNIDEIPHDPNCSQRFARSDWWATRLLEQ